MNYLFRPVHMYRILNNANNAMRKKSIMMDFTQQKCQTIIRPFSDLISNIEELNVMKKNVITDDFIMEIAKNDSDVVNRLKILMLEVEVTKQDGRRAPEVEFLSKNNWEHLLSIPSRSGRQKYLAYLWRNEKMRENLKEKKAISHQKLLEVKALRVNEEKKDTEYGLTKNSMFLRIYETSMNQLYSHRLMQAMLYGQKIVLDCSYDKYMSVKEALNAAKQLTLLYADNRIHDEPFNLQLCNCSPDSIVMKQLEKYVPTIHDPTFPITIHNDSYLNHFPKEKLVYLTPHCRNDLTEFDSDAVYIIGCMVDKIKTDPISLAKAKQDGLKMARLPLDKYLQWGAGSGKSLTINQVANVLLDLNRTGDWNLSLKHVPVRKLVQSSVFDDATADSRKQNFRNGSFSRKTERRHDELIPSDFKKRRSYQQTSLWSSE